MATNTKILSVYRETNPPHPRHLAARPATQKRETNPMPPSQQPTANGQQLLFTKRTQSLPDEFTKRTQSHPDQQQIANSQKLFLRNEPNSPKPTANRQQPKAAFHETNPIPPTQQPIANSQKLLLRNEPNLRRRGPVEDKKCRSEAEIRLWRTKRTQLPPRPKTQPPLFMRNEPNLPPGRPAHAQKMRNEPKKSSPAAGGPPPI